MTVAAQLQTLLNTKSALKQALIDHGLSPTDELASYAALIASLSTGGDSGGGEDFSTAQVGDEIGGGIYAGTITYADARQFHIIAGLQESERTEYTTWGEMGVLTGADDFDDGAANQALVLGSFDDGVSYEAFYHCRDYSGGGFNDWYLPAKNEHTLVYYSLVSTGHPEFSTELTNFRWSSTENNNNSAWHRRWSADEETTSYYKSSDNGRRARPIRRVAV